MRSSSILLACLCLAACGGDAPAPEREQPAEAPAQPAAAPARKKDSASVERRQRHAEDAGRDSARQTRMQGLGDAVPQPGDSLQQKAP